MRHLLFIFSCFFSLLLPSCSDSNNDPVKEVTCDCSFDPIEYEERYKKMSDIHFMVTADPQYNFKEMNPDQVSVQNADWVSFLLSQKICCENYRGVIISGDLTHFAREDEYRRYQKFIQPIQPFVFDGLGNHDFAWAAEEAQDPQAFIDFGLEGIVPKEMMGWKKECLTIWEDVRKRPHIPQVNNSYPNLHYSWDWGNVHGIQLNLFPGSATRKGKPAQNPFDALTFLKNDLETQVGNSGRPVILSHHYGLDFFSIGSLEQGSKINPKAAWWTAEERKKYWDLLQDYNVIAIFSGHAHYCDECYLPWDGTSIGEANVGPDFIPTFVAGAAREAKYLECHITADSLVVKRFAKKNLVFRKAFAIER